MALLFFQKTIFTPLYGLNSSSLRGNCSVVKLNLGMLSRSNWDRSGSRVNSSISWALSSSPCGP